MRTQLLIALVVTAGFVAGLVGCQTSAPPPPTTQIGPVEVGGFVQEWQLPLGLSSGEKLTRLTLRQDMLFAYTSKNAVYAISAAGGQIIWITHIGQPGDQILPPLVVEKKVSVIPGVSSLTKVDADGHSEKPIEIGHSIRSGLAGNATRVYCGLDYPTGGRLAQIDLTKAYNNTTWEFMTSAGISAAPVLFQAVIYAGGEDGNVYAVNEQRNIVWPLEGGIFKTGGRIVADLQVDTSGLYVASTDTKLYCLDPATGKIKWQYFATLPLVTSPALTADSVYQAVPGIGVVALDKITGDFTRKPRWIAGSAKQFLAEDADNTYLRGADDSIIGVDKKTGEGEIPQPAKP